MKTPHTHKAYLRNIFANYFGIFTIFLFEERGNERK